MKTRYPEYINGVKQIQNPLYRLAVRVWYSDWFRMYFILMPLWMMPFGITLATLGVSVDFVRNICIILYLVLCGAALAFNDYTNLYRIGLDTDHTKIEVDEDEMH